MKGRGIEIEKEKRGLQERWNRLIKNIWDVGREIKMVKEIKGGEGEIRDRDIKIQKRNALEALMKSSKTRNEEGKEK